MASSRPEKLCAEKVGKGTVIVQGDFFGPRDVGEGSTIIETVFFRVSLSPA